MPFSPALSREFRPYKPHPAPLLHICSNWEVPPNEVMMIGDSLKDDVSSLSMIIAIEPFPLVLAWQILWQYIFFSLSLPYIWCLCIFVCSLSWSCLRKCTFSFIISVEESLVCCSFVYGFSHLQPFRWPVGKEQVLLHACLMKREGMILLNTRMSNSNQITKCLLFLNFIHSWKRISTLLLDPNCDGQHFCKLLLL